MNLSDIQTPALILDLEKFEKNCKDMKDRLGSRNVKIRPHLKTGKCLEFAKRQMTSLADPATVSTLLEAEYFFNRGINDILYAVSITPSKFERTANLIRQGCSLKVILDNETTAKALSAFCKEKNILIPVLIEIDCDGHRSGITPTSDKLLSVAEHLTNGAKLVGVLTHAGDSYKCYGEKACLKAQENERDSLVLAANRLRELGYNLSIISAGSTPTARFGQNWDGVTEVRCGVYCTYDLVMAGLGVCSIDEIALSVLVEVIGYQSEKGWIITDGGWMALSRDRGTAQQPNDRGYGLVCNLSGKPIGDLIVASANQEHGIICSPSGQNLQEKDFPIGTRLRILPNHACPTAAQHPQYFVTKDEKIVDIWKRFYGWQ